MNTLLGDNFKEFIEVAEKDREKHLIMNKQLKVKCVLEIAKIIAESSSFSSILIALIVIFNPPCKIPYVAHKS